MATDSKVLVNLTRGTVVCEHGVIADSALRRMRGLLGRRSLPAGEGLLLQAAASVRTAFMRFPIDVVFLDRQQQVVKIARCLQPWRTTSARRACSTLELAAGEVSAREIRIGDALGVVTVDGMRGAAKSHDSAAHTRVLIVGKDRRFRSVAMALLTRRGCAVTFGDRLAKVAELARQESAEVVVIDVGSSLPVAAREAAEIQTLDPPVGVVLVRDDRQEVLSAMPIVEKWGSFEDLCDAIERARPSRTTRSSNGQP
jgi:uncharacterized membrane protein (UPF0127 family)